MEKQVILSILRSLKVAIFEENANNCFLGTLVSQDYKLRVYLYRDSVCQYVCLEYPLNNVKDIEGSAKSINERVIAGKYSIKGNDIILQSFFPILEDKYIEQQVKNSICVIERMVHICKH